MRENFRNWAMMIIKIGYKKTDNTFSLYVVGLWLRFQHTKVFLNLTHDCVLRNNIPTSYDMTGGNHLFISRKFNTFTFLNNLFIRFLYIWFVEAKKGRRFWIPRHVRHASSTSSVTVDLFFFLLRSEGLFMKWRTCYNEQVCPYFIIRKCVQDIVYRPIIAFRASNLV